MAQIMKRKEKKKINPVINKFIEISKCQILQLIKIVGSRNH